MSQSLEILSVSLYQMDIESSQKKHIPVNFSVSDLSEYLGDLLNEIDEEDSKRSFVFGETKEVYMQLCGFSSEPDFEKHNNGEVVAERLLLKEVDTDNKYGHLSSTKKGTHVKKGSYLQFLYKDSDLLKYLGVKVDHQGYLDETDLKKHIGLALSEKVYKAIRATYDGGFPSSVEVYDSHPSLSKYWWSDFLELTELRTDSYNTKKACESVVRKIGPIKSISRDDYKELRNSVIVAFKQKSGMEFNSFVDSVFSNYVSENEEVNEKLKKLIPDIRKLPDTKEFDSKFNLDPSSVPYRNSTYKLDSQITLTVEEGVNDIDKKIWSEKTADGDELVVIKSPDGFKKFKVKERKL